MKQVLLLLPLVLAACAPTTTIIGPNWRGPSELSIYPERALHSGVEGYALLGCRTVGADRIDDCEVLLEHPEGWGFGAAALHIAPGVVVPSDGEPSGARVMFGVPFCFEENCEASARGNELRAEYEASMRAPSLAPEHATIDTSEDRALRSLVSGYLDRSNGELASIYNLAPAWTDQIEPLWQGAEADLSINVHAGVEYRILGACDNECFQLHLVVSDAWGEVIGSDLDIDDNPVVEFVSSSSGPLQVKVRMISCSIAPCYAGIRLTQRRPDQP